MTLVHVSRCCLPDYFLASELAAELYVDEVLDGNGRLQYVDRSLSVSALAEAEAADRFYGVQMEIPFTEGDPHGS